MVTRTQTAAPARPAPSRADSVLRAAQVLGLLFVFLLGVHGLGAGFTLLGQGLLESFFAATENPFLALMIGIISTSIVQSSSVTTSLIVGLVAAPENPLPIANAVPMIMGANFGTTVTNTIVALAHLGRRQEFRRAFAVSTCDDFFELFSVSLLLPLEMATGFLQKTATALTSTLTGFGRVEYESPIRAALKAGFGPIETAAASLFDSPRMQGALLIVISGVLIFGALMVIVKLLRAALLTRVESVVSRALDQGLLLSMLLGTVVTMLIQSSSITTSLLVPLAGAGLLSLKRAYPIVLGANIGTTFTALMAALGATGPNAQAGLTIALVHLAYNLAGVGLIFPVAKIRDIPLKGSRWLAEVAMRSPRWAIFYVVVLFYGVPASFALLHRWVW